MLAWSSNQGGRARLWDRREEAPVTDGVVDRREVGAMTLITLAGELDFACAGSLRRALAPLPGTRLPDLAVDLRAVTFMDCAAVGVLVSAYRRVRATGGCLRLIGPQHASVRLLDLCRLDAVLCVHDSVEAATAQSCAVHAHGALAPDHSG
jgi:anti-sigma B factor antagonist